MSFRFLDQFPVYLNASGDPCAGGTLTFYNTGTTTPKAVWTDKANTISATNPHVLNSQGRPTTDLWGSGSYRVVLIDSGGAVIWSRDDVDELLTGSGIPSQATHSGKFLTTNGSAASWATISQVPSVTGNAGKYLYTDGTAVSWRNPQLFPSVQSVVSSGTLTPSASEDGLVCTALAAPVTIANPTGSWGQMQGYVIRLKDDGTARAITWGSAYRAFRSALPTTTVAGKTMYIGLEYNTTDSKFDVVAVSPEV